LNREEIIQIINRVLSAVLVEESAISEHAELTELGLNSLRFIRMVVDLEEELNIMISDEDLIIEKFSTKTKIYNIISSLME